MPTDPGLGTPRDFVQSGWDYQRAMGAGYVTLVQTALGDLTQALNIVPVEFDANLDLPVDYASFVRPVAPVVPELGDIDVTVPTAPAVTPLILRDLGEAPAEPDFSGMVYQPPAKPDVALPTEPTDLNPVLDEIVVPDAPTYSVPVLPTLYALNLPDPPTIVIAEFEGVRPNLDVDDYLPERALNWQEIAYSSDLLNTMKSRLSDMLAGGLGLPAHIEQAIFDRGRARGDLLANKRVQEIAEELAARGLDEPGGLLARRLDQARMEARMEAAGVNRDLTIKVADMQVESVRFALAQAGTLEATLLQVNQQINQRSLDAAKIGADMAQALFNAVVTRANLEIELFKTDAQVHRDRIDAELAKATVYKAQIDGQVAIGNVNEGLVRAYAESVRAIGAYADMYRAQVEGVKAKAELNTQRIEAARLKVQVFSAQVEAYGKVQDAFKTESEAALGSVRVFEAIGNVYGQRVSAYKTKGEAYFQEGQLQIAAQGLGFDGYRNTLEGVRTLIAAQSGSIDARARTFQARAGMYQAEGAVVAAEAASNDRTAQTRIEAAKARVDVLIRNADARSQQNVQIHSLYVELLKAKAQVVSQLAAATLSGVNFGASYNGSLGVSTGYSVGFNYSGDTESDLSPPYVPFVSF